ncbi:MAG: PqiC family protein [Pseudomonadota bacterium]
MITNRLARVLPVLSALFFSACATDPPTKYFALHADPAFVAQDAASGKPSRSDSFGIGPVRLPGILQHPGIVTVKNGNQLLVSSFNVWAGNLEESIGAVLADNLSTLSANHRIWSHPWDSRNRPQHQIRIIIEEFSGSLGGEVSLRAKWVLLSDFGKQERQTNRIALQRSVATADYTAYVAAMNDLLSEFSHTLYQSIDSVITD